MQIRSLKIFCDLAETESFTKTAHLNQVTQSAVSQQISTLERVFKSSLIERSKKKFRLTREGQAVYDYSKQILRMYDSLDSKLQDLKNVISGTIRVAAIYTFGLHDLPIYLKKFLKSYPTVNVHVEYRHFNEIYDDVLSNVVDLGVVAYPRSDSRLETVPLRRDKLVLICHPQNSLAKSKTVRLRSLAGVNFVAFETIVPIRKAVDRFLRDHGVQVRITMELDNIETLKRAVEIDVGVAFVPASTVVQEVADHSLAQVEIEDATFHRPVVAIYKKSKVLSPAMKKFLAVLRED